MPENNMPNLTDRGGAVDQNKNWTRFLLPRQTHFLHCGSAPLRSQGGTGLLVKYSKEVVTVNGYPNAPSKFILAVSWPDGDRLTPEITVPKLAQMMWEVHEMPHAFMFTLVAGTPVWSDGGQLHPKGKSKEVGIEFDVIFAETLLAEYVRVNKAVARDPRCPELVRQPRSRNLLKGS
jgi:hypothetical protein